MVGAAALLLLSPIALQAGDKVTIEVSGVIETECAVSGLQSHANLGQLSASGTQMFPFQINCNTPFGYELKSSQGGLRHTSARGAGVGFTTLIPYTAEVKIPTDTGLISDQCGSQIMALSDGCAWSNSGNGISINETGSITIAWSVNGHPVAGSYSDLLTLNVFPRF
jgi:hypothetical protein